MITVKVNKSHIESGVRKNSTCCPIALSIKYSQKKKVSVDDCYIYIGGKLYYPSNNTDKLKLRYFVRNFDNGDKVYPTIFNIERA